MPALLTAIYRLRPRYLCHCGVFVLCLLLSGCSGDGRQSSVDVRSPSAARLWNEVLLEAIRDDFARPTVHARNLFHLAAASYDAWAVFSDTATTWLLGKTRFGYACGYQPTEFGENIQQIRETALSHANYRLLRFRFSRAPGREAIYERAEDLMRELGHDPEFDGTDYRDGSAAALGNHIADCYIGYGLQDGSNEPGDHENLSYQPVNPPIEPALPGNPNLIDPDRWQPVRLVLAIDQSGNPVTNEPEFLSPEWGSVNAFALRDEDRTLYQRDGQTYAVYHDPGVPPPADSEAYKWGFSLVSVWSSHLTPYDGAMIDISPASVGNLQFRPTSIDNYPLFYNLMSGGDPGAGHALNPVTGEPYVAQVVPRGDYARVLAEFWADGPDSETPPGHWFVILNSVNDHPLLARRFNGSGDALGPLEWDVKAYFALGGAMHDAAITAWGAKGWYDYIRPLSAIRGMGDAGQSSDPGQPSWSPAGLPLIPGRIEVVLAGDPLAGPADENVGKIKLFAWRGPDKIDDPQVDFAGVGWILAEHWWPYQRPTFVTPPFAGYVSGHSTYSRAAAEVLASLTGDEFFPGGMSQFEIRANEFLVFEQGPTVDMTLQWATYADAADQCSLSRIWGGIHPPADDLPGRHMGEQVGQDAFALAARFFDGTAD